ncbi:hypothetical protein BAZSYMB_GCONTIG00728_1 [Bathymodiolus azoricus thioautotrophic gill symbiont]|uniref:Uncharacterized protein n=1 Tax=Bathymodiolus azoricus thioautotrophic gill symbiont TaxID=235205 RepID=A0A1H6LAJ3_9GAMM|nr:hypothetical protein BAZSYMB_GCONTIG00728_1 [Bathymodiolus azoricus thioautotrophic gill symbiont]
MLLQFLRQIDLVLDSIKILHIFQGVMEKLQRVLYQ